MDLVAKPSKTGSFLPILFEDTNLLILDKFSGVHSTSLSESDTETAVGSALAHCPALTGVGKPLEPGLLHRLDRDTSGVLAFAKSQKEFDRLRAIWKTDLVTKTYRAQVWVPKGAALPDLPHWIEVPLGRSPKSTRRVIVAKPGHALRGKPLRARTLIVGICDSHRSVGGQVADVLIQIQTGVMHQIRVHLSSQGFPILGDPLYAGKCPLSAPRLCLHAWRLALPLADGNVLRIEAPIPHGYFAWSL